MENLTINTMADVRCFFYFLMVEMDLGHSFHPDTPIEDYVNNQTGEPTFEPRFAFELQRQLEKCFHVCRLKKADIYELGVELEVNPPRPEKIKGHKLRWNGFWGKWQVTCPAGTLGEFDKVADALDHIERNQ